ncbi:MAG: cytochrome c oxidase subunit II [Armatimonadetes bacterium]|nr:cytochrome c oxidase subunit II [Armatimonadota bacterium]
MGNSWLTFQPEKASSFAGQVDALFYVITALTIFFTAAVGITILILVNKYKRGKKADRSNPVHDHQLIEAIWTFTPLVMALAIFVWSTNMYIHMRTMPKHSYEAYVIGKQWMWHIQHPNGIRENNELTVPAGQPVKLTMISQDVIHAFYVPAFRSQYHVVPGRYTSMWFTPTKPGSYHIFCNMLCGTQHSEMVGKVNVLSPKDFAAWLDKSGNRFTETPKTLAQAGEQLFNDMRCGTCHGVENTERGPSLHNLLGSTRVFTNGATQVADEDYLRESMIDPFARITKGYSNTMPVYVYKKQINEEQIRNIIEYIKSLGTTKPASSQPAPAGLR